MFIGGPAYSVPVLLILLSHEFGHYLAARFHRVPASLPYFIPLPPPSASFQVPPFGTMGAVIGMSPSIPNRRALFDIAAAGPLAGIIVAIPITLYGILVSQVDLPRGMGQELGEPLLFQALTYIIKGPLPEGPELYLSATAFAGWVGMLVTAFNLMPLSQLDGGHISYALLGPRSIWVARFTLVTLIAFSIYYRALTFLLLFVLLAFVGIGHPPTMDDRVDIGPVRRVIGVLLLVTFILCFTPMPFVF